LLQSPGANIWIDPGPGTLANLQRHITLESLTAIWISHVHADHFSDILIAWYALAEARRAAPIPVFGPLGWERRVKSFFDPRPDDFLEDVFSVEHLEDGHNVALGGISLTSRQVEHDVPTFGLRASAGTEVVAYSGDSRRCPAQAELARNADVFLCEAYATAPGSAAHEWHMTPEDASAIADQAMVRRLVLTHLSPTMSPQAALARAGRAGALPPIVATDGLVILSDGTYDEDIR
jgi:ribonuclease BN (tRNA processing enzyme)